MSVGDEAPGQEKGQVGLNHMAWMMHSLDDLKEVYQRIKERNIAIDHVSDHGISIGIYVRDPDGHRTEIYTSDYLTVDPDFVPVEWNLHDPQRQTLWGQPAPRSWFEEGSFLAGAEVQEPVLKAQPIVAP